MLWYRGILCDCCMIFLLYFKGEAIISYDQDQKENM